MSLIIIVLNEQIEVAFIPDIELKHVCMFLYIQPARLQVTYLTHYNDPLRILCISFERRADYHCI